MPDPHWENLKEIFHAALALAPPERAAYLEQASNGDLALRQAVESLLKSHEETDNFVDAPAYQAAAQMLVDDAEFKAGQTVAHYRIVSLLGEGGMGKVYLAEDTKLRRRVSLKFLSTNFTQDHERLRRFEQEARAISALNHPNTLTIHDIKPENIMIRHDDGLVKVLDFGLAKMSVARAAEIGTIDKEAETKIRASTA